jgi:hypothetical protein
MESLVQVSVVVLECNSSCSTKNTFRPKSRLDLVLAAFRDFLVDLSLPKRSSFLFVSIVLCLLIVMEWWFEWWSVVRRLREVASCLEPRESICLRVHWVAWQVSLSPHITWAVYCRRIFCVIKGASFSETLEIARLIIRRYDRVLYLVDRRFSCLKVKSSNHREIILVLHHLF